jgi:hypothetical protein
MIALTETIDKFNRFQASGSVLGGFWKLLKTQFDEARIQAQREEVQRLIDTLAGEASTLPENVPYWMRQIQEAREELDRMTASAAAARGELNAVLGVSAAGGGRGFVNPEPVKRTVRNVQDILNEQESAAKASEAAAKRAAKAEREHAEALAATKRLLDDAAKASAAYADSLIKNAEAAEGELQRLRDQYIELTAGKAVLTDIINLRTEERAIALERAADATGWEFEAQQRARRRAAAQQIALRQGPAPPRPAEPSRPTPRPLSEPSPMGPHRRPTAEPLMR